MKLKDIKNGQYFKKIDKKGNQSKTVYVREFYSHSERKYNCSKFDDCNAEIWLKSDQEITTDFEF